MMYLFMAVFFQAVISFKQDFCQLQNFMLRIQKCGTLNNKKNLFKRTGSFDVCLGRHQTLQVENSDLIKARLIDDMHLKF